MKFRMKEAPEHVSKVLERELSKEFKDLLDFYRIKKTWAELVGMASNKSKPIQIQGRKLQVIAASPLIAQEINMRSGQIISRALSLGINIDSISVYVGNVLDKDEMSHSSTVPRLKPLSEEDIAQEVERAKERFKGKNLSDDMIERLSRLYVVYNKRFNSFS